MLKAESQFGTVLPPQAVNLIGGTEKGFSLVSFVKVGTAEQPKLKCYQIPSGDLVHEGRPSQWARRAPNSFCVSRPRGTLVWKVRAPRAVAGKVTKPLKERGRERSKPRSYIFHKRVVETIIILRPWSSCTQHA